MIEWKKNRMKLAAQNVFGRWTPALPSPCINTVMSWAKITRCQENIDTDCKCEYPSLQILAREKCPSQDLLCSDAETNFYFTAPSYTVSFWWFTYCQLIILLFNVTLTAWLIALMMEAASSSIKLVKFYQITWHNIPEDSRLHTCHHENLKSHHYK
jgi:hypothetical protein